jgi:hypothetical protein
MRAIFPFLLGSVLVGVLFAQQPAQEKQTASKPAMVHFYGDGYFGVRHVPLYIDGHKVGNLHGHEVVDVPVVAGKHTVYSGDKKSGIFLEAADGTDYYVKITLGGSFVLHGQVALVDPSQGQFEVQARRKDQ